MAGNGGGGTWDRPLVGLAALLTLAMTAGPMTAFGLSALGPVIVTDLDLGRAAFGLLTTILFAVAALASSLAGRMTDRVGGERLMIAGFGLAAAALLMLAAARSYATLVLVACVAGLSVAISNPATNKMIMLRVPPQAQSAFTGIKQAGVLGAGVVAGSVLPWGASAFGWRWPVAWCALLPAAAIVLARLAVSPVGRARSTASPRWPGARHGQPGASPAPPSPPARGRGRIPGLFWLRWYAFFMGAGHLGVVVYLPLYAFEVGGLSAAGAGSLTAVLGLAGVCARIGLGAAGDRLGAPSRLLALLALLAAMSKLVVWASPAAGAAAIWTGAFLFGATSGGWSGLGQLATLRAGGERLAGTASGAVTRSYYAGFLGSPAAFGYLLEFSGTYAFGWGLVASCSLLAITGARRFAKTGEAA